MAGADLVTSLARFAGRPLTRGPLRLAAPDFCSPARSAILFRLPVARPGPLPIMATELVFRLCFAAVPVANLPVAAYFRYKAYQASGKAPPLKAKPLTRLRLMTLPLTAAGAAYVFAPGLLDFAGLPAPSVLRWLGAALGAVSVPWAWWVFVSLGDNMSETILTQKEQSLVTRGPYRWIRHPLYTHQILVLVSLSFISANAVIAGCAALALCMYPGVIRREETDLLAKFGDAYRWYMRRTGRVLPRLRRANVQEAPAPAGAKIPEESSAPGSPHGPAAHPK